jgi:hypothetical protein
VIGTWWRPVIGIVFSFNCRGSRTKLYNNSPGNRRTRIEQKDRSSRRCMINTDAKIVVRIVVGEEHQQRQLLLSSGFALRRTQWKTERVVPNTFNFPLSQPRQGRHLYSKSRVMKSEPREGRHNTRHIRPLRRFVYVLNVRCI